MPSKTSERLPLFSRADILFYALLTVCAIALWRLLNLPPVVKGDTGSYLTDMFYLINRQFELLAPSVRTYGYPVFLASMRKIANILNLPEFYSLVVTVQFAFHILTAFFAAILAKRFLPVSQRWGARLVFGAVLFHPYLLVMATHLLTETVSVLLLTLFFYFFQSEYLHSRFVNRALMGLTLGMVTIVRPFHLVWGLGVIGIIVLAELWSMRVKDRPISYQQSVKRMAHIILFFALMAGTQAIANAFYKSQVQDTPPTETTDYLQTHLNASVYSYRYETWFDPAQDTIGPVYYINQRLYDDALKPEIVLMPFIKFTSLFQQHDYVVFRPALGIVSPTAFVVGLVLWIVFCYVGLHALHDVWQAWKQQTPFPLATLLTAALVLYVALYAVFTVPEPRFIFPIQPLLIGLFAYYASRAERRVPFLNALLFALMTYSLTAYTLLWSLHAS